MYKEIHNLLKIENDKTTIFTNKELKMIDDYINELESYKYNMDRDYLRLEKENQELKKENKILRENAEHNDKVVDKVNWENQKLKKQLEEYKLITIDYQDLEAKNQKLKKQLEEANEKILLLQASEPMLEYKKALEENQQKEFIDYLENEKYRLAGECSPTYEGSLGKKRFVNEDIFNEVDKILSKYYEIIEK